MELKTVVTTERRSELYLTEHDLAVLIGKALGGQAPEITTTELDWDISQGSLLKGVFVKWSETETRPGTKEIVL